MDECSCTLDGDKFLEGGCLFNGHGTRGGWGRGRGSAARHGGDVEVVVGVGMLGGVVVVVVVRCGEGAWVAVVGGRDDILLLFLVKVRREWNGARVG